MFIGVSISTNPDNFCHVDIIDCREFKHTEGAKFHENPPVNSEERQTSDPP